MKPKQFFLITGTFLTVNAVSQPVIDLNDLTPSFGISFTTTIATYVTPGEPGANQAWDFSLLESRDSFTIQIESPEAATARELFPDVTNRMVSDDENGFKYMSFAQNRYEDFAITIPFDDRPLYTWQSASRIEFSSGYEY